MVELQRRLAELAEPGATRRITTAGKPYPGVLPGTSGPNELQQMGIEGLEAFLKSPLPMDTQVGGMAKDELEKTLGGEEYDPIAGPYYQAYRSAIERELGEAKDRLASRTSARDKFFGGGRIASEGELEETAMGDLEMVLGSLFERERERRLGAVPTAMGMLGEAERYPVARAGAAFGAPDFEERGRVAEYNEYMRQMNELGIPLDVALGLATYKPEYYQPTYGPSEFERYLIPAAQATAGILGATLPA
jgi:hypothetical protein